jgi:hypothetical protein
LVDGVLQFLPVDLGHHVETRHARHDTRGVRV